MNCVWQTADHNQHDLGTTLAATEEVSHHQKGLERERTARERVSDDLKALVRCVMLFLTVDLV